MCKLWKSSRFEFLLLKDMSAKGEADNSRGPPPPRPPPPKSLVHSSSLQQHLESLQGLKEERVRWFVKEDKKWTPFNGSDSLAIERCYRQCEALELRKEDASKPLNTSTMYELPTVKGSLYEVDVVARECIPIYWKGRVDNWRTPRGVVLQSWSKVMVHLAFFDNFTVPSPLRPLPPLPPPPPYNVGSVCSKCPPWSNIVWGGGGRAKVGKKSRFYHGTGGDNENKQTFKVYHILSTRIVDGNLGRGVRPTLWKFETLTLFRTQRCEFCYPV